MSALAAIVLLSAPAVASTPPADQIVVIGRKMATWRGKWATKKGAPSCRTTKSTGDREIDAIGCASLVTCVTPIVPQMQAIADMKLPREERNRRLNDMSQLIGPCVTDRRGDAIAALATRRRGA